MPDRDDQADAAGAFPVEPLECCRALQDRLREIEAELEHTHRLAMLGTLVGSIAHEINNILTPVVSYAELAKLHPDDAELGAKALARASAGAEQAARIARAILDLARRAEYDSGPDEPPRADIAATIDRVLLCMAREPGRDAPAIRVEVEPGCTAAIDPTTLQQVLLNLLINATRAIGTGGGSEGRIDVRGSTWNSPGREAMVRIEVEDDGCGMDERTLERIFEPFISGGSSQSSDPPGTGLGLSTSRQLVERFGGTIAVRSQVGTGTVFTITLPCAAGEGEVRKSA